MRCTTAFVLSTSQRQAISGAKENGACLLLFALMSPRSWVLATLLLVRGTRPRSTPALSCALQGCCRCAASLSCSSDDEQCVALSDLYEAAGGEFWTACTGNWTNATDVCTFECVSCSALYTYVDTSTDVLDFDYSSDKEYAAPPAASSDSVVGLCVPTFLSSIHLSLLSLPFLHLTRMRRFLEDAGLVGSLPLSLGNLTTLLELSAPCRPAAAHLSHFPRAFQTVTCTTTQNCVARCPARSQP